MTTTRAAAPPVRGFSLVELMVAMVIGLIVLAAVSTVFVNSHKNYHTTEGVARLQENMRAALHFLGQDIRRAGFFGCNGVASATSKVNGFAPVAFSATEGCSGTGNCTASDSLSLNYLDFSSALPVLAEMDSESGPLLVGGDQHLNIGDIVAIADCDTAEIFQISNIEDGPDPDTLLIHHGVDPDATPGNTSPFLGKFYRTNARIFKLVQTSFDMNTDTLTRDGQPLVEGIESIQIQYGVATIENKRMPNKYTKANAIPPTPTGADGRNGVVTMRVGLLLSSISDTATGEIGPDIDTRTYPLGGDVIDPPDERRIRKTVVTTVETRNIR